MTVGSGGQESPGDDEATMTGSATIHASDGVGGAGLVVYRLLFLAIRGRGSCRHRIAGGGQDVMMADAGDAPEWT